MSGKTGRRGKRPSDLKALTPAQMGPASPTRSSPPPPTSLPSSPAVYVRARGGSRPVTPASPYAGAYSPGSFGRPPASGTGYSSPSFRSIAITQERVLTPLSQPAAVPVPAGWEGYWNGMMGLTYYHNAATGETVWAIDQGWPEVAPDDSDSQRSASPVASGAGRGRGYSTSGSHGARSPLSPAPFSPGSPPPPFTPTSPAGSFGCASPMAQPVNTVKVVNNCIIVGRPNAARTAITQDTYGVVRSAHVQPQHEEDTLDGWTIAADPSSGQLFEINRATGAKRPYFA